ncbi:Zn-dependent hydrolase [Martelella endophytica]|uniref:N-carbamoyl-L-amino acid amidohydrolase n=1 Tax=Martelella endophytica TaxID=1486262 RepID=A0A0D5LPV5_MAREN|nr:Zn-dependent hydrolase [Martelella endophytica]AJY45955.1 N-carbamoyl-L-amino acid amidohydrolase [Martelella endophytica]
MATAPTINSGRLRQLLDGINRFGASAGGFNRPGFSDADMAVRDFFAAEMERDGLVVFRDGANSVFGRFGPADGPCIMAGSHLDTVVDGGAFDGALGVAVALECVRAMKEVGIVPATPIEVAATSEEEGRFGGMLGSQAMAGLVTREWLDTAVDADGLRLTDAMAGQGLNPESVLTSVRPRGSVKSFLELHIEQGPVLEREGIAIGLPTGATGIINLQVTLSGVANHSGTTPMEMRADAFAGLAEIAVNIPALIEEAGSGRITIGKVELQPNHPHTVPGEAVFSVIIRDGDEAVMDTLNRRFAEVAAVVAKRHRLGLSIEQMSVIPPVGFDPGLVALLEEEAARFELPAMRMISGAGHDAQTMMSLCPSAMIFVPSRDGISHAPQEFSEWSDIEKGAELMLAALVRLSAQPTI